MNNRESVITLIRVCTERDKKNGYILNSTNKEILSSEQALQEMLSHELNAKTERGIFYSFTYDVELAKRYKLRNPENTELCCVRIDLANLPAGIRSIHPIFSREYIMSLICLSPEILCNGKIQNPATGREHSILGILNSSQRTVCSWAHSMGEIVVQCDNLELEIWNEENCIRQEENVVNRIIRKYLFPQVSEASVKMLRGIMESQFKRAGCICRQLIDRVNDDEWAKLA